MGTADMRQAVIAQYPHAADYDDDSIIEIYYRSVVHDTDHPDFLAALARNRREVWREERERMRPRPAGPHREQQELALAGDSAAEELVNQCAVQNGITCGCLRVTGWLAEQQRRREYRQYLRRTSAERGACIECDRPLLEGDGRRCMHCAMNHAEQERRRRERRRVNQQAGLCKCGKPATETGRCRVCNLRHLDRMEAQRDRRAAIRDRRLAEDREKNFPLHTPHASI